MENVNIIFEAFQNILRGFSLDDTLQEDVLMAIQKVIDGSIYQQLSNFDVLIKKFEDFYSIMKFIDEKSKILAAEEKFINITQSMWDNLVKNNRLMIQIYCALFQLHLFSNKKTLQQEQHQYSILFNSAMETFYDHYVNNFNISGKDENRMIKEFLLISSTKNQQFLFQRVQDHLPDEEFWFLGYFSKTIDILLALNQEYFKEHNQIYLQRAQDILHIFLNLLTKQNDIQDQMGSMFEIIIEKISLMEELSKYRKMFSPRSKFSITFQNSSWHPIVYIILNMLDSINVKGDLDSKISYCLAISGKPKKETQNIPTIFFKQFFSKLQTFFHKKQSLLVDFQQMMIFQLSHQSGINHNKNIFILQIFVLELVISINQFQLQKNMTIEIKQKVIDCLQLIYPALQNQLNDIHKNIHKYTIDIKSETKRVECAFSGSQTKKYAEIINSATNKIWLVTLPFFSLNFEKLNTDQSINLIDSTTQHIFFPALISDDTENCGWNEIGLINLIIQQLQPDSKQKVKKQSDQNLSLLQTIENQVYMVYEQNGLLLNVDDEIKQLAQQLWLISDGKFNQLVKVIQILISSFLDDPSITIRIQIIEMIGLYHKNNSFDISNSYQINYINKIIQQLITRSLDTNKQVRIRVVELLFEILKRGDYDPSLEFYDSVIDRFHDVDSQVRLRMLLLTKDNISLIKGMELKVQQRFFNEILQRLGDSQLIANKAAYLLTMLLSNDQGGNNDNKKTNQRADKSLGVVKLLIKFTNPIEGEEHHHYHMDKTKVETLLSTLCTGDVHLFNLQDILISSLRLLIMSSKNLAFPKSQSKIQPNLIESQQIIEFLSTCLHVAQAMSTKIMYDLKSVQNQMVKYVDALLDIIVFYINYPEDQLQYEKYDLILDKLFEILIFLIDENIQQEPNFQITNKIAEQLNLIKVFTEKMSYKISLYCRYLQNMIRLRILLDLQIFKTYQEVHTNFETSFKLITLKFLASEESVDNQIDSYTFHFSLIMFSQYFEFIEHFLQRTVKDPSHYFQETIIPFYELLLEMTTILPLSQFSVDILSCIQKIWQKFPSLLFKCQDFLIQNLKKNNFNDNLIIQIYKLFQTKIEIANNAAKVKVKPNEIEENQETDIQTVVYLIKEVFMITFKDHIMHKNKNVKLVVLQLLEKMFENQLTIALQFGPYLIGSLIDQNEQIQRLASRIIHKSLQSNFDHISMSFQEGIDISFGVINQSSDNFINETNFEGYFTHLDSIVKNMGKDKSKIQKITKNEEQQINIVSDKLTSMLSLVISNKNPCLTNQIFLSSQLLTLRTLSQHELQNILIGFLQGYMETQEKLENSLQKQTSQSTDLNQNSNDLVNQCLSLLARSVYAHLFIYLIYESFQKMDEVFQFLIEQNGKAQTLENIILSLNPQKKTYRMKQPQKYINLQIEQKHFNLIQMFNQYIVKSQWKDHINNKLFPQIVQSVSSESEEDKPEQKINTPIVINQNSLALQYAKNILDLCDDLYRDTVIEYNSIDHRTIIYMTSILAKFEMSSQPKETLQEEPQLKPTKIKQKKIEPLSKRGKSNQNRQSSKQPSQDNTRILRSQSKPSESQQKDQDYYIDNEDDVMIQLAISSRRSKKRRAKR